MFKKKYPSIAGILIIGVIFVMPVTGKTDLSLFNHGYPRFFQFRQTEGYAASGKYSYAEWERLFAPYDGIEGKVLEEEVPGRSVNLSFFTRFKKEHPEKLVLLHMNGRSRDPRYNSGRFYAGHWLYYNGCKAQSDIPAVTGLTTIKAVNVSLFRDETGRYGESGEDLVIYSLKPDGKPDWNRVEQVSLVAVDRGAKTIQVKRGCYGTKPLNFKSGRTWIAAHVTEGPWGKNSHLLWQYNFSLDCPKDGQGRTCADILVDELGTYFQSGGILADFDGLEFDVLLQELPVKGRGIDSDGDGVADNGYRGKINRFGWGVYNFLKRLRERLGNEKLIMADGMNPKHQRAFDQLNGIESEGWPDLSDPGINDWSGGINRYLFWRQNARNPVFNYINHKFRLKDERINVTPNINRLVFAAAQFTDAVLTYSDAPPAVSSDSFPVWDELVEGTANQQGWLGKPLGPPVRLARYSPDLLGGKGNLFTPELIPAFSGEGVRFNKQGSELLIEPDSDSKLDSFKFKLEGIIPQGPDLTVFFKVRAEPLENYPQGISRLIKVRLVGAKPGEELMTWANQKPFEAGFYFPSCNNSEYGLEFEVEGTGRVWLSGLSIHAYPDAIYREFEHGLVLGNPAPHDLILNLQEVLPGRSWRRIQGTPFQDPKTNNGAMVGKTITLGSKDGLFLIRE